MRNRTYSGPKEIPMQIMYFGPSPLPFRYLSFGFRVYSACVLRYARAGEPPPNV